MYRYVGVYMYVSLLTAWDGGVKRSVREMCSQVAHMCPYICISVKCCIVFTQNLCLLAAEYNLRKGLKEWLLCS